MERSKDRKLGFMEATFASFLVYLRVMFGVLYYTVLNLSLRFGLYRVGSGLWFCFLKWNAQLRAPCSWIRTSFIPWNS